MASMDIMYYHIQVWKITGTWWYGSPEAWWFKFYRVLVLAGIYVLYPFMVLMLLTESTDVSDIGAILYLMPTAMVGIKTWVLIRNKRDLLELFSLMDRLDTRIHRDEHHTIVGRSINEMGKVFRFLSCQYYGAVMLALVAALTSDDRQLLMKAFWSPVDYHRHISAYYTIVGYQTLAHIFDCLIDTSLDSFAGTLYSVLASHLDVLGIRLKELGHNENYNVISAKNNRLTTLKWETQLNECINTHYMCLRYAKLTNRCLSLYYIVQFVTSLTICGALFQLAALNFATEFSNFLAIFIYMSCMMVQLFVPCYFASKITEQSNQLALQLYRSNWLEQSLAFKCSMIILVERSKKPIVPMAGGLFAVGLPLFVSIMKTGYSIFSLMKNVDN